MVVLTTLYNGIRYRSRAEARWAVVFDTLRWKHHYEPDGYLLPSGPYLPDFYLPQLRAFFEVKARMPTWEEKVKAAELCVETTETVIVSTGPPNHMRHEWYDDLLTFVPELLDDEWFAFSYEGGFVSRRREYHPACSIHLGNLAHVGTNAEVQWEDAFQRAVDHRFGVYEGK